MTGDEHAALLQKRVESLEAFKAYVHQRLDAAGVPTHPDGPHSAEGCRVGDRLDLLIGERDSAQQAISDYGVQTSMKVPGMSREESERLCFQNLMRFGRDRSPAMTESVFPATGDGSEVSGG